MARAPGKRKATAPKPTPAPHPPVFYSLHALLHTVRILQEQEDQLCALLHELRTTGTLSPALAAELNDLLDAMPTWEYQDNLEAVRSALALEAGSPTRRRKHPPTTAKHAPKPGTKHPAKPGTTAIAKPGKKHPVKMINKAAGKPALRRVVKQAAKRSRRR